jgi:hypothetical protein
MSASAFRSGAIAGMATRRAAAARTTHPATNRRVPAGCGRAKRPRQNAVHSRNPERTSNAIPVAATGARTSPRRPAPPTPAARGSHPAGAASMTANGPPRRQPRRRNIARPARAAPANASRMMASMHSHGTTSPGSAPVPYTRTAAGILVAACASGSNGRVHASPKGECRSTRKTTCEARSQSRATRAGIPFTGSPLPLRGGLPPVSPPVEA